MSRRREAPGPGRTSRTCCAQAVASAWTGVRSAASSSAPCSTTARCRSSLRAVPISSRCGRIARRLQKACRGATSSSCCTDGAARPCSPRARASGRIPDAAFERMVDSRTPFWADVDRGNERFRVYFMNDRGGIYALGYPVITAFGHLINLAELVTLALALFAVLIAGATIFNTVFSHAPATGRALLREIRSSFYRKLRLAFVAGSVLPGGHPRPRHPRVLRQRAERRHRGRGGPDGDGRATPRRRLRRAAAARAREGSRRWTTTS